MDGDTIGYNWGYSDYIDYGKYMKIYENI